MSPDSCFDYIRVTQSASSGIILDDFEDQDQNVQASEWSGWSGDNWSFSTSTTASGSVAAVRSTSSNNGFNIRADRNSANQPAKYEWYIRTNLPPSNWVSFSRYQFLIRNSSSSSEYEVYMNYDGNFVLYGANFGIDIGAWAADTWYKIVAEHDFSVSPPTVTLTVTNVDTGSEVGSATDDFLNGNDLKQFLVVGRWDQSDSVTFYLDGVKELP